LPLLMPFLNIQRRGLHQLSLRIGRLNHQRHG
jgi:hypothetical protein